MLPEKKQTCLYEAGFKNVPVYTEMLEMTGNDGVPMPGLVGHCKFTPCRRKKKRS